MFKIKRNRAIILGNSKIYFFKKTIFVIKCVFFFILSFWFSKQAINEDPAFWTKYVSHTQWRHLFFIYLFLENHFFITILESPRIL